MIVPEKKQQLVGEAATIHVAGSSTEPLSAGSEPALTSEADNGPILPPAYADVVLDGQADFVTTSIAAGPPSTAQPTNFLSLSERDAHIRGCYTIDPLMRVPASLLAPLKPEMSEEDRHNLDLRTKDGNIDAEIWLVGRKPEDLPTVSKKRTTLYLYSKDGNVQAKVNTVGIIAPFSLDILARDGRVTVLLPRSFHGPLLLTCRSGNSVILSESIQEKCTPLSTVQRTRRFFVGDTAVASGDDWDGDELKIEARDGKIRVRYLDEIDTAAKSGFLSRMLSYID
ncbi:hypothetical protein BJ138DRAFT_181534 [Hygrophoropsis aurantiaca]|uniref:Uncharacterized protein n=1 Tax=Hygrophoropsis aurantiaca TaxID=72124 RepID=A0ACB8A9V3_9AGAM|nr:hypothetical protein BJ138DRAFT_181534 [Hygrophoropsis aurantiaca]